MKRLLAFGAILALVAGCSLGEVLQNPGDPVDQLDRLSEVRIRLRRTQPRDTGDQSTV